MRWSGSQGVVANVIGPLAHGRRKEFRAPRQYVRMVLQAGQARGLLGIPLHHLADQIIPLQELWPSVESALLDNLNGCSLQNAMVLLQTEVRSRLQAAPRTPDHAPLFSVAMRRLSDGTASVAAVATAMQLSERHLRRLFLEALGMTPKHYARVSRLRRVLLGNWQSGAWSALALDVGLHDQSHLIREFRDLMQVTPEQFRRSAQSR